MLPAEFLAGILTHPVRHIKQDMVQDTPETIRKRKHRRKKNRMARKSRQRNRKK